MKKIEDKDLIQNLKDLYTKLGRVPKKSDVQVNKGSKFGNSTYTRAFGGLGKALIAAGLVPNQVRGLSKECIIQDIREVCKKLGRPPTFKEYQKYSMISYSFPSICAKFNSWRQALKVAKTNNILIANKVFKLDEIDDSFVFFTKEEIYNYHVKYGKDRVFSNLVMPFYDLILLYISINGWIYPKGSNYLEVFENLKEKPGVLNSSSIVGSHLIKSHFKSYWNASFGKNPPPTNIIYNKDIMLRLLKYRFGISNSKMYKYKFNGCEIEYHELFDMSLKQVRRSLEVNRYVVSIFKPLLAKYVYQKYGFDGMRAWDPCAGFGGRMLGFLSAFKNGLYIGSEPNPNTHSELVDLGKKLNVNVSLIKEPVENLNISDVDLVFTCPPYDFKEHYCDDKTQSDVRYSTYNEWVSGFLTTLAKKSYNALRKDGKCIMVFDRTNSEVFEKIAIDIGYELVGREYISNTGTHLNRSGNSEVCIIFSKT